MSALRALIIGAVLAGCLAGPVYAQQKKSPATPQTPVDLQKIRDAEAIDKEYKATLERTRKETVDARTKDPWQNMRGSDDPKTKK